MTGAGQRGVAAKDVCGCHPQRRPQEGSASAPLDERGHTPGVPRERTGHPHTNGDGHLVGAIRSIAAGENHLHPPGSRAQRWQQRPGVLDTRQRRAAGHQREIGLGQDQSLVPLFFEVNTWAMRKGLTYTARADGRTRAMDIK